MRNTRSGPRYFFEQFSAGFCLLAVLTVLVASADGQDVKTTKSGSAAETPAAGPARQPESPSLIMVPNGMAVVTGSGADGPTIRLVDISQFGPLWGSPANLAPNYIATTAQMPLLNSWNTSQFNAFSDGNQAMRALAVSSDGTRIYAGSTGYGGTNKTPNIYVIGPSSTTPVRLATLPSYVANVSIRRGIGGLDLDEVHNAVFASSFADGIIYRRDASTGANLGSFDPLTPYSIGNTQLPPYGERIVAVAYHRLENRIYYSTWGFDWATSTGTNTVRSVGLDAAGAFVPATDRLEFIVPGSIAPVADIEFNSAGTRMLVAEENLLESLGFISLHAHSARALEYAGNTGAWTIDPAIYPGTTSKYNIGAGSGTNSRGGVAWGYSSINIFNGTITGHENFVVFTADALRLDSIAVYGLQYSPSTGGSAMSGGTPNSVIADLDYDVVGQDKFVYGDVDIRRSSITTSAAADLSGRVTRADGSGISKARIILVNAMGETRTALTNAFGYYRFEALPTGETYFLNVSSKSWQFNTRVLTLMDEASGIDFIALE